MLTKVGSYNTCIDCWVFFLLLISFCRRKLLHTAVSWAKNEYIMELRICLGVFVDVDVDVDVSVCVQCMQLHRHAFVSAHQY